MELTEIIKSTLSIFTVITFIFIIVSYIIYKIKDRTRIKPFLRINSRNLLDDNLVPNNAVKPNDNKKNPKNGMAPVKLPKQNRFNIINVNKPAEKLDIMDSTE
jgi:hypothetical protein